MLLWSPELDLTHVRACESWLMSYWYYVLYVLHPSTNVRTCCILVLLYMLRPATNVHAVS